MDFEGSCTLQSRRVRRRLLTFTMRWEQDISGDIHANLRSAGWLRGHFECVLPELPAQLKAFAEQLGQLTKGRDGRPIEVLSPRSHASAFRRSLSAMHGRGMFPLHTDGAHLARPPRYVLLACVAVGRPSVPTVLARADELDLDRSDISALEATPFLVRNGRQSFYATVIDAGKNRMRYDRGCMMPTAESSWLATRLDQALEQALHHPIEWCPGDLVVIDNWRVLHGRGIQAEQASEDRILLRAIVQ
jgi:hypothetical protein